MFGVQVPVATALAPGVPADYYHAIAEAEGRHWWHLGMLATSDALL